MHTHIHPHTFRRLPRRLLPRLRLSRLPLLLLWRPLPQRHRSSSSRLRPSRSRLERVVCYHIMYVYSIYAPAISIADANTLPQQQRSSSSSLRPSRNRLKTICVYVVCYHIMCVLYIHTCVYAPTIAVPQQQQQAAPKQEQVGTFLYVNGSVGYFIVLFECM